MAKTKQTRRMMAMALAAAVTMSSVPVVAFADEVEGGSTTTTNHYDGSTTTTTTTTSNEGGVKATLTVSEKKDADGKTVNKETTNETVKESVSTDSEKGTTTTTTQTDTTSNSQSGNTTTDSTSSKTETSTVTTPADGGELPSTGQSSDGSVNENGFDDTLGEDEVSKTQKTEETTITVTQNPNGSTTTTEEKITTSDSVEIKDVTDDEGNGDQTDVTVNLNPGETVTETVVKEGSTVVTGDADKTDGEWNYTEESVIDRTVTVEASDVVTEETYQEILKWLGLDVKEDWDGTLGKEGVIYAPSGGEGNYNSYVKPFNTSRFFDEVTDDDGNILYVPRYTRDADEMPDWLRVKLGSKYTEVKEVDEQGNEVTKYVPVHNKYWELDTPDPEGTAPDAMKNPHFAQMEGNPDFDFVFARAGEYADLDYKLAFADGSVEGYIAIGQMRDEFGNLYYAYCMDKDTGSIAGDAYVLENLDDAEYFLGTPEEQAEAKEHVRAIALNGYWGTTEGTGSLDQIKSDLEKFINANPDFSFTYDDPATVKGTADETTPASQTFNAAADKEYLLKLVEKLNEGGALIVTQSAIWEYGRDESNPEMAFDSSADADPEFNQALALFRAYLLSDELKTAVANERDAQNNLVNQETTIIDENTFLVEDGGLSVTVGDKVEGNANNQDDDQDNDVYNTDISFTMVVTPGKDDDLVVTLVDSNGDTIRQARIAGEQKEGETYLHADENGTYTFTGLELQENSGVTFDLKLEGTQHLQEGVYIYKSVLGYDYSQTRVTVGGGTKQLDVNTEFTVQFDVDENDKTVVKKSSRTRTFKTNTTEVPTTPPEDPTTPPGGDNPPGGGGSNPPGGDTDIPDPDVPLSDIPDEDVPLADIGDEEVPLVAGAEDVEEPMVLGAEEEAPLIAATGDSNHMAAGFGGMFAALAGMFMLRRKKEQ